MRIRLLLPAWWLLSVLLPVSHIQGQSRPRGPWRLTYRMVERWWQDPDTTKEAVRKWLPAWSYHEVKWDVEPDSIRLFLNCENPLIVPSRPGKGQLPIRFTATGATVKLDAERHRLLIAPSASTVTLWAYRGRVLVFKHLFQVMPPPLPTVEIRLSDPKQAIWERTPPDSVLSRFTLSVRATPAEGFATILPTDARYRIPSYQFALIRSTDGIGQGRMVKSREINIPRDSLRIGNKFRVAIEQVQRMNFRGIVEDIPMQETKLFRKEEYGLMVIHK
ncbi:hypothetical protein ACFST9_11040 [Hymenobacter monticola]|uniref:Uncharacterized protein n=1 Tax=Hymenobacter monticola TaxID=1705399 RepID=A0ABY4B8R4_9BACT|nr:hypothetical protein [Hymenobacter monticola]UOE35274.1 hypothetical protein MTP16_06370 [Hymenobacter monticola]